MPSSRLSPGILLVWLALLVCLGLSIVQNIRLRKTVGSLQEELSSARVIQLGPAPGDLVSIDSEGNKVVVPLGEDGGPATILLVASGYCGFCQETMPQWRSLETSLGATAQWSLLRIDGRIIEGKAVLDQGAFGPSTFTFPGRPDLAWTVPAARTIASYRLRSVPQTIVVRDGNIVFVKTGPLDKTDLQTIRASVTDPYFSPTRAAL